MDLERYVARRRDLIDRFLAGCVAPEHAPSRLHAAMRYSIDAGGKRLRPLLAIAACEAVGGKAGDVMPFACAIEMIHTYSLIHDDLPAMDDDDLRRGKPTSHKVFGEALAILAGDALLTEAFAVMGRAALARQRGGRIALQALTEIASAAGARGMVAGQAADIEAEQASPDLATVEFIHVRKTGELLRASVRAGGLLGGARPKALQHLTRYGDYLGLAFQVADDILDVEGATATTGKNVGRDQARHKATYPAVIGLPAAKERLRDLRDRAVAELSLFEERAAPLRQMAHLIVGRACPS